jgi:hypothetical protein
MRMVEWTSAVVLMTMTAPGDGVAAEPLRFQFEPQAQQHCPSDSIIWADAALHLYNVRGERWYGSTKSGVYMCLREAEQAGYRTRRAAAAAETE